MNLPETGVKIAEYYGSKLAEIPSQLSQITRGFIRTKFAVDEHAIFVHYWTCSGVPMFDGKGSGMKNNSIISFAAVESILVFYLEKVMFHLCVNFIAFLS